MRRARAITNREIAERVQASGLTYREFVETDEWAKSNKITLGMVSNAVSRSRMGINPDREIRNEIAFTESSNAATASSVSTTIRSGDDLMAACNVDMKKWEIERETVKTFTGWRKGGNRYLEFEDGKIVAGHIDDSGEIKTVTLYSVQVWLKPRASRAATEVIAELANDLPSMAGYISTTNHRPDGEYLLVPAIMDAHIGRRALDRGWTVEVAAQEMLNTADRILDSVLSTGKTISEIMFPIGNDALDVDNLQGMTTNGTPQETSAPQKSATRLLFTTYRDMIIKFASVAPCKVYVIEGNHDRYSSHWLGLALEAWFRDSDVVTINNAESPCKYYEFGSNMFGMIHGDRGKTSELALRMAVEEPEMWGRTKHRFWFRGHAHRAQEVYHSGTMDGGVCITTFAAFCPPNEWERVMGFFGRNRAAEARVYHRDNGFSDTYNIFIE